MKFFRLQLNQMTDPLSRVNMFSLNKSILSGILINIYIYICIYIYIYKYIYIYICIYIYV